MNVLFSLGLTFLLSLAHPAPLESTVLPVPLAGMTIVVDPGHGGVDPGAHYQGRLLEKNIVLGIGRDLQKYLKGAGAKVIMTRTGDYDLAPQGMKSLMARKRYDLKKRVGLAGEQNADLLLSLHVNSDYNPGKKGAYVYYSARPGAREAALNIQRELNSLFHCRGQVLPGQSLYVLRASPIPAVIVETGFISNRQERERLVNGDFQHQVAWAIFKGIQNYYQKYGLRCAR